MSSTSPFHADSLTELKTVVDNTLLAGDTSTHQANVILPVGISGQYYLYVKADDDEDITESIESNNMDSLGYPIQINLSPWIDLTPTSIETDATVNAGATMNVSYTVKNVGTAIAESETWSDKIYLTNSATWSSGATLLKVNSQSITLGIDSSYTVQTTVDIPIGTTTNTYYLHIFTDSENTVYEYNFEDNNRLGSSGFTITGYPPVNLELTELIAPDSVMSGTSMPVQWSVQNIANNPTISPKWNDAIYLSLDTVWNANTDISLGTWEQLGSLASTASYTSTQSVNIPNGLSGQYYLIAVTDKDQSNNDADWSNNSYVMSDSMGNHTPIVITLTPPPDLQVSHFSVPTQGTAGQPVELIYTVTNNGTAPTLNGTWVDKIYLSTDLVLNNDTPIGSSTHSGNLAVGESYTDTIEVFLPINVSGNRVVIIKTDANNVEYEHDNEDNNTSTSPIHIVLPPPSDLIISDVTVPNTGIAGESVSISWTRKNIGHNPAIGVMKEAIYLSKDTIWDIDDALVSVLSENINLAPQAQSTKSIIADLTEVSLGDYHAIVRTDILNNIYESNDTNNVAYSTMAITIDVKELPMNVLTPDSLENNKELYYRLHIPDSLVGESILVSLKGDSVMGANQLYIRHENIPTPVEYDHKHILPYSGNQKVIIPAAIQGNYYLMAYGSTMGGTVQDVSLYAEVLNFEIQNVNADRGGNTGAVTVQVNGAKFDSTTLVLLASPTDTIIASMMKIESTVQMYATFNLTGKTIGLYDVIARKVNGETAYLHDGFTIEQGLAPHLATNLIQPANTRPNRIISLRLEYSNQGNTDIVNPIVVLKSLSESPIATHVEFLSDNFTELTLLLQEPGNPLNRLRPGASGTIIIYSKDNIDLGFLLETPDEY